MNYETLLKDLRTWIAASGLVVVILAVALVAEGFPPKGGSTSGTIVSAERYHASQVSDADVGLGDQGVAKLMQTDAFELMVKNPSFRALVMDPGFQALAQNPSLLAALAKSPEAFAV